MCELFGMSARYPDGSNQRILLLSTAPLDEEPWESIPNGTLRLYAHGEQVDTTYPGEGIAVNQEQTG